MTTLTAWFLIVSGVTYGGFVSYSPPMPTKTACENFKKNIHTSLQNESNFIAHCVENTIYVANPPPTQLIPPPSNNNTKKSSNP